MQTRPYSFIRFAITGILAIIVFFLLILFYITQNVNTETIKNQLAEQLSQSLGATVAVKGNIELTLFPKLHLSIFDITLTDTQQNLSGSIDEAYLVLNPFSLLGKQLVAHQIQLIHPQLIIRDDTNEITSNPPERTSPLAIVFTGSQVLLKHSELDYKRGDAHIKLHDGNILLYGIDSHEAIPHTLRDFIVFTSLKGRLTADLLEYDNQEIKNVDSSFAISDNKLNINHLQGQIAQGFLDTKMLIREQQGLLHANASLSLNQIKDTTFISTQIPLKHAQSSINIKAHSTGVNSDQLFEHLSAEASIESIDGELSPFPMDPLLHQWNLQAKQQQSFSSLPKDKTYMSHFRTLSLKGQYHNHIFALHEGHLSTELSDTYVNGYYNTRQPDYYFNLLINLPHITQQALRNEMNSFFHNGLLNTIPAIIFSEKGRNIITLDTDYVDVSKLILGKGLSSILKGANYTAFSEQEDEIKAKLFQDFKEGFNP